MPLSSDKINAIRGLSDEEVQIKLNTEGFNELPSAKKKTFISIAFEVMKEPMFILLIACGVLYLILGDIQEAIMLLGFVIIIIGITIYQEGKTEKALDALRDLSSPRALVIRDGERKRIAGREVVRGDYLILAEGDRVPADGILIWGINLAIDESILTGESIPVEKLPGEESTPMATLGGDSTGFVYSGTLVVQGQGIALVKETGGATEMGKIGKSLRVIEPEETLLKKETGRIVKTVFVIAVILCTMVIVVYGLTQHNWLKGILSGITLAMALLPEEFPVVLAIFLALGAWRMSKKNVLTRKVAAIETLGAATVLCVDKTGTLTQNKMSIQELYSHGSFLEVDKTGDSALPENYHELVEFGMLASKRDPFDPMEKALMSLGYKKLQQTEHLHDNWELIEEYPLSRELLALSHVWQSPDKTEYCIAAKGAPEAIADLCHLSRENLDIIENAVQKMAAQGLRVLGVARASFTKEAGLPGNQHDFDFSFCGLLGLADPIRELVPAAVKECYRAGIRVVMITGDYPITACNIAKQIGLANADNFITGQELKTMSDEVLVEKIKSVNVFARVIPEQKLKVVSALKANGEIVAMTGDGVNDAPALKASNIGIAMGERGTDVAREASNLVLLDDAFSSIVEAVKMGRRIFDNLRKAMAYIISVHIPIAGMSLIPVLLQWKDMVLHPVHIVFLELIIDPACSVVFESEPAEKDIMDRKPRSKSEHLFNKKTLLISTLQGIVSLAIVFSIYLMAPLLGQSVNEARTLSFITLIVSNLCLILANRSWSMSVFSSMKQKNTALIVVITGAIVFLGLFVFVPVLRDMFYFGIMHPIDIAIATVAGIVSVLWFEALKFFINKKRKIRN